MHVKVVYNKDMHSSHRRKATVVALDNVISSVNEMGDIYTGDHWEKENSDVTLKVLVQQELTEEATSFVSSVEEHLKGGQPDFSSEDVDGLVRIVRHLMRSN